MTVSNILKPILWAVLVYAALTVCALAAIHPYAQIVRPFYRWELSFIAPAYSVQQFDIDRARGELAFDVSATNREVLLDIGRRIPPRSQTFRVHILVLRGLEHVVILLLVPLAWPGLLWKRRLLSLACALPILCLVEFADLPWVIVGGFDSLRSQLLSTPDTLPMIWAQIEETGGHFALALVGGVLACWLPSILQPSAAKTPRHPTSARRRAKP